MRKLLFVILMLISFSGYLWAILRTLDIIRIAQHVGYGSMFYSNFIEQTPISLLVIIIMFMLVVITTKRIGNRNQIRVPLLIGMYFFSIEFSRWLTFALLGVFGK